MIETIKSSAQRDELLKVAFEACEHLRERMYLVGGALRDMALQRVAPDLDFAAHDPRRVAAEIAKRLSSRVVTMGTDDACTYRVPAAERFVDIVALVGGNIETDLARRDFTVNSMAYEQDSKELCDPFGGIGDLRKRSIRMTSARAFAEDPLRILKAYRMMGQLEGFTIDGATEARMVTDSPGLKEIAPERLSHEIESLMKTAAPGKVFRLMAESGVLFHLFPQLAELRGLEQNKYHHTDVLNHSLETLENLDGIPEWFPALGLPNFSEREIVTLRLAALMHDLGKSEKQSTDEDGSVHFYGHPKISAELSRRLLEGYRFPKETVQGVSELCLNHLRPLGLIKALPGRVALRRLIHSMGDLLPLLLALSYADKSASRGEGYEENLADLAALCLGIQELAAAEGLELKRLPKLIDGLDAMRLLNLDKPGPELGVALDALMEKQVDGTITTTAEAVSFLMGFSAAKKPPPKKRRRG